MDVGSGNSIDAAFRIDSRRNEWPARIPVESAPWKAIFNVK